MILLGPELTLNGGFEDHATEPQSWGISPSAGSSLYVVSSYPFAGDNYAKLLATTAVFGISITNQPPVMVASGENYRLSSAISPENASLMVIEATNSAGTSIGLNETFTPEEVTPDEFDPVSWHFYTWDFGCTASAYPRIALGYGPYGQPKHTFFDAVSFRRKIEISVSYDYKNGQVLDRILARNVGGSLRIYTGPGSHRKFNVPVSWASLQDANTINSWWQTGTDFSFIENEDFPNSYYNVRLIGDNQPLNQYQQAHFGEFMLGVLDMETV